MKPRMIRFDLSRKGMIDRLFFGAGSTSAWQRFYDKTAKKEEYCFICIRCRGLVSELKHLTGENQQEGQGQLPVLIASVTHQMDHE